MQEQEVNKCNEKGKFDLILEPEVRPKVRKKKITEVEKLQIGTNYHMRPMTDMTTTLEQRRPKSKIAKYKGPSTNDVIDKEGKEDEGRNKKQRKASKNVNVNLPNCVTI